MRTTPVIVAAGLLVIALGLTLRTWIRARGARRRVAALAARLGGGDALTEVERMHSLEAGLGRLERAVDEEAARRLQAGAAQTRFIESLQRLDEGVVVADEAGHILFANPAARRYLGGRHVDAVVDRGLRELLRQTLEAGVASHTDIDLIGPPRVYLRLAAHPLDDRERSVGAVCFVVDMSEQRRVDTVRRDFVANISHELKTPVGALGLLAETLSETLDEPEVAQRLTGRLVHEAQRLVRIIDDLLALSRLEAEESPQRERVPIDLVVAEAVDRLRAGYDEDEVVVDCDIMPGGSVIGDRRQLTSAVYNLIENAVKYSESGTPVTVVAAEEGGLLRIAVTDRGVGIPQNELARIFERFYRVDRARSRATGGTGLGLSIVRHVAANHGGQVRVRSELGNGSTFTFEIPSAVQPGVPTSDGGEMTGSGEVAPLGDIDATELRFLEGAEAVP